MQSSPSLQVTRSGRGALRLPSSSLGRDHRGSLSTCPLVVCHLFISNDPDFVAKLLHERDEIEVLRAAKAMLYDSYMKALNGEEMKHG